jgi:hypothetical protein
VTGLRFVTLALAACLLLPGGRAVAATFRDFTSDLRRSIAIAGREGERFRLRDRMAHYRVPGISIAVIDKCRIVDVFAISRCYCWSA